MKTMSTTRKLMIGTMFAAALIVGGGQVSGTTAQAQIWRGPRVVVVPGARVYYPVYPRPAYWGPYYYGYTPRYDAGPYDVASEKGYHDGFDRGREDAHDGRRFDPNNSSHFRDSISAGYRDGFRRGYATGFREVGR
jgi:hypothetical protein